MRKTARTDNEITLFSPKLTGSSKATIAFVPSQKRVPVYARFLRARMANAFPKKRFVCTVQQTISHADKNIPSQNKAFRHCLLRQGCCSALKACPTLSGTGKI